MSNQYDITRHIDYENHMRNYISKSAAKKIIDNLKSQLDKRPIQAHPDYSALVRLMEEKHQKDLSRLEQEMRKKLPLTQQQPIHLHADYPKLVAFYEDKVRAAVAETIKKKPAPAQCPPPTVCPECPECPKAPRCPPVPSCAECPHLDYTVTATSRNIEPRAFNNFQLGEDPGYASVSNKISSWLPF